MPWQSYGNVTLLIVFLKQLFVIKDEIASSLRSSQRRGKTRIAAATPRNDDKAVGLLCRCTPRNDEEKAKSKPI